MLMRVSDFSKTDTVLDVPAHLTPGNILTAARNVTLTDGVIAARHGIAELYGAPAVLPYAIVGGTVANVAYWLYAGLKKIYKIEASGADVNVTRQTASADVDYAATETTPWTTSVFNGVALLNNTVDVPQMFSDLSGKCKDLTNWPSTLLCQSLRPFKNFLVALNVTESGTNYPQVLRWSHRADPGAVPSSWDYTDPTKDAGRVPLAETSGILLDGLASKDAMILYKDDSTYLMQFIGGVNIFSIRPISFESGILATNCVSNFSGGQVALTGNDVVLATAQGVQSIAKSRIRAHLFNALNASAKHSAFVVTDRVHSEVWVCVPTVSSYADAAYVWNWLENKWTIRELPALRAVASGYPLSIGATWDADTGTWDADTSTWGAFDLSGQDLLGVSPNGSGKIVSINSGTENISVPFIVSAQHEALDIVGDNVPPERLKLVPKVRPHFTPESVGAEVTMQIGMQMTLHDAISWTAPVTFTIGSRRDLFVRKQGRYMSWKITSSTPIRWGLSGFDVFFELGGDA